MEFKNEKKRLYFGWILTTLIGPRLIAGRFNCEAAISSSIMNGFRSISTRSLSIFLYSFVAKQNCRSVSCFVILGGSGDGWTLSIVTLSAVTSSVEIWSVMLPVCDTHERNRVRSPFLHSVHWLHSFPKFVSFLKSVIKGFKNTLFFFLSSFSEISTLC